MGDDGNIDIPGINVQLSTSPTGIPSSPNSPWITPSDIQEWSSLPPYVPTKGITTDQFLERFRPLNVPSPPVLVPPHHPKPVLLSPALPAVVPFTPPLPSLPPANPSPELHPSLLNLTPDSACTPADTSPPAPLTPQTLSQSLVTAPHMPSVPNVLAQLLAVLSNTPQPSLTSSCPPTPFVLPYHAHVPPSIGFGPPPPIMPPPKVFNPYSIKSSDGIPYSILTLDHHVLYNRLYNNPDNMSASEHSRFRQLSSLIENERTMFHDFMRNKLLQAQSRSPPIPPIVINYVVNKIRFDLTRRLFIATPYHRKHTWSIATDLQSAPYAQLTYHSSIKAPQEPSELELNDIDGITIQTEPASNLIRYWERTRLPPVSMDETLVSVVQRFSTPARHTPHGILSAGTLATLARIWAEVLVHDGAKNDVMFPVSIRNNIVMIDKPMAPEAGCKFGSRRAYDTYYTGACRAAVTVVGKDHADYVQWELKSSNNSLRPDVATIRILVRTRIDGRSGVRIKVVPEQCPSIMRNVHETLPVTKVSRYVQAVIRGDAPIKSSRSPAPIPPRVASVSIDAQSGKVLGVDKVYAAELADQLPAPRDCIWGFMYTVIDQLRGLGDGQYLLGFGRGERTPFVLAQGPDPVTNEVYIDLSPELSESFPVVYDPTRTEGDDDAREWVMADPVGGSDRVPNTFPVMPPALRAQLENVLPLPEPGGSGDASSTMRAKKKNKKRKVQNKDLG